MKCYYEYGFRFESPDRCGDMIIPPLVLSHILRSPPSAFNAFAGNSQLGPFNRAYANLFYPSMHELWPEVYGSASVRTVEVRILCILFFKALSRIDSQAVFAYVRPSSSSMSEVQRIVQCGVTIAS